jgi:hypothetical protein
VQCPTFHIVENLGPELNSITHRDRVGVLQRFLRAGQNVQPTKNYATSLAAIPICDLVGAPGKGEVDADPNNLWQGLAGWWPL